MIFSIQNYTTYSIKSGIGQIEEWVNKASELGYEALGISDKQTAGGWVEFQMECDKRGIKPILGEEFLVTEDVSVRDSTKKANVQGVILLYAKDDTGLENIISLNNFSNNRSKGFYYYPRIDLHILEKYSEGVICVVPVEDGYGRETQPGLPKLKTPKQIYNLLSIFGDDLYIGLNPISSSLEAKHRNKAVLNTFKNSAQYIYTFNTHYPREDMEHLYEVVRKMDKTSLGQLVNFDREVTTGHLPSQGEITELCDHFHDYIWDVHEECLKSFSTLLKQCNARVELNTYKMPVMETETGSVKGDIFKQIGEGFKRKLYPDLPLDSPLESLDQLRSLVEDADTLYPFEHVNKGEVIDGKPVEKFAPYLKTLDVYLDRIEYEIEIIEDLGFFDYFQIISYICKYVDSKGLGRGFARGSAGGSLVSYLLDITKVDPIRHDLLFDRFLNRDRQDLPDIDLDFSVEAREEVKRHVREKWGETNVCNVGTYGRLKIVSAIKDISATEDYSIVDNNGHYIQYSFQKLTEILKSTEAPATYRGEKELEERLSSSEEFQDFYNRHSKWIHSHVLPLQDMILHTQVHAAGTLITREPLDACVPVYEHSSGELVSQWQDRHCERAGHPKFDFLTVEGVNVIEYATRLIESRHDIKLPTIEEIPLDDPEAMEILSKGDTVGIFQLGSYLQLQYGPILKPSEFNEVVASLALIRPGPMEADAHNKYERIKNGKERVQYDHKDLEPVLRDTYGLLVYQEQMMEIARVLSNFEGPEADHLRKATGKKKLSEMVKWKVPFIERGIENGYSEELMNMLWDKIVVFSEYAFNKSHSVGYALISYYQAYLKARYPVEYWCAVLQYSNSQAGSDRSPQAIKALIRRVGIEIIYPTIYGFSPDFEPAEEESSIYWPLKSIKGIGPAVLRELTKDGRRSFESIEDMVDNTSSRTVHKGIITQLIKAGFFSPIAPPWDVAEIYFNIRKERGMSGNEIPPDLRHKNPIKWQQAQNDAYQMIVKPWKEVDGFHPKVRSYAGGLLERVPAGRSRENMVFIGGLVKSVWISRTRYGGYYARVTIVDEGEEIRVMCWPEFFESDKLNGLGENGRFQRFFPGQLVELLAHKDEWVDGSGNVHHQVSAGNSRCYSRVIWDELDELIDKHGDIL